MRKGKKVKHLKTHSEGRYEKARRIVVRESIKCDGNGGCERIFTILSAYNTLDYPTGNELSFETVGFIIANTEIEVEIKSQKE